MYQRRKAALKDQADSTPPTPIFKSTPPLIKLPPKEQKEANDEGTITNANAGTDSGDGKNQTRSSGSDVANPPKKKKRERTAK